MDEQKNEAQDIALKDQFVLSLGSCQQLFPKPNSALSSYRLKRKAERSSAEFRTFFFLESFTPTLGLLDLTYQNFLEHHTSSQ